MLIRVRVAAQADSSERDSATASLSTSDTPVSSAVTAWPSFFIPTSTSAISMSVNCVVSARRNTCSRMSGISTSETPSAWSTRMTWSKFANCWAPRASAYPPEAAAPTAANPAVRVNGATRLRNSRNCRSALFSRARATRRWSILFSCTASSLLTRSILRNQGDTALSILRA